MLLVIAAKAPLRGTRPMLRWLVRLVLVSSVVLLPWAAYLAVSLPSSVSAKHWSMAWTGFDVAIAIGFGATAWFAIRLSRSVVFPAVATATLLVADAWFDVCTASAGRPLFEALADAGVEVGEAIGCVALAVAVCHVVSAVQARRGMEEGGAAG